MKLGEMCGIDISFFQQVQICLIFDKYVQVDLQSVFSTSKESWQICYCGWNVIVFDRKSYHSRIISVFKWMILTNLWLLHRISFLPKLKYLFYLRMHNYWENYMAEMHFTKVFLLIYEISTIIICPIISIFNNCNLTCSCLLVVRCHNCNYCSLFQD